MAKPAHVNTNGFDPSVVNAILRRIDEHHAELLSERGSYMAKCRSIREHMQGVYDDAKAKGVPTRELKTLVKIRIKEAEAKKLYLDLETDAQDAVRMLAETEKVADLPLWRAPREQWQSVPGVDVARHAAGEHPEPMFEDNVKHAKFKQL